jgi:hypothetical protein
MVAMIESHPISRDAKQQPCRWGSVARIFFQSGGQSGETLEAFDPQVAQTKLRLLAMTGKSVWSGRLNTEKLTTSTCSQDSQVTFKPVSPKNCSWAIVGGVNWGRT